MNLKSNNLQYNTLVRWDKYLVDQVSDVPGISFFHNFLQTALQNVFQFIIYYLFFIFRIYKIENTGL